jgi:hypothetical protein
MEINHKDQRINDLLTHLAFGIWAVLALWFFQERLYSDSGFYLSKVITYEAFWIELSRFVLVFSEWLPLLCIKLGCSLKTVLIAYSLGHVLFCYALYWIGRYRWGSDQIGWFLIAIQTVGILHGFCAPGFELYYVGSFLGLFAVILDYPKTSKQQYFYLFLLTFIIVINYLLASWIIGGLVLLHFSRYKFKDWKKYLGIFIAVLFSFGFKKLLTTHSYEIIKMEQFMLNLTERHYNYKWDNYVKPLLSFYGLYYKEVWIIALITFGLYLRERRYFTGFGYLAFLLITQYIIALTYPGVRHSRYQEQCYFPLIFVACFPLIMDLSKGFATKWKWVFSLGLFSLIVYRFVLISIEIEPFTHRVNYMHRVIETAQKMEGNKFIMHEEEWNPKFAGLSFMLGMESMLLSGLNPDRKTIQIIRDTEWLWQDSANVRTLQDSNLYLFTYRSFYDRTDSIYQHETANPKYFNFPPGKYRYLNGQAPKLGSIEALRKVLTIKTYPNGRYKRNTSDNILVKLTNIGSKSLNSNQIRVAYHWWKDGEVIYWEGHRNPLELDLLPQSDYYQYILVKMPEEPGRYELQVDVIAGPVLGWMYYPARVPVVVY